MKNEFLPYDRALKLKQLGFEDECMAYYEISVTEVEHEEDGTSGPFGWKQGEVSFEKRFFVNNLKGIDHTNDNWVCAAAPLFQQAFRWFREEYNQHSFIELVFEDEIRFDYVLYVNEDKADCIDYGDGPFETYEDAELALLDKLIEIAEGIKSKK
jgi:hypothetical protein